jgi:hypothetical protein
MNLGLFTPGPAPDAPLKRHRSAGRGNLRVESCGLESLPGVDESKPDWQPLTLKSRSETVHPPDTGGPSLLLVASALLFSVGRLLYAVVRSRM